MTLPGDAFMNRAVTVVWVTLALGTGTGAAAQAPSPGPQFRIAFVKSREILQSTPGYASAESTFNKEVQGFRDEVQKLQQQLDSAVQAFDQTGRAVQRRRKNPGGPRRCTRGGRGKARVRAASPRGRSPA